MVDGGVVANDVPAFAGCDGFVGEEGEAADVTKGANVLPVVVNADGLGGVFDDVQVVLVGECADVAHVGAHAGEVNGHDGACAWGEQGCAAGDVELVVVRGDIDKDGGGTCEEDGVCGCDEGAVGDEDFIARADVEGGESEVECERSIGCKGAVGCADDGVELGAEGGGPWSFGDPARFEDEANGVLLFVIEPGGDLWDVDGRVVVHVRAPMMWWCLLPGLG